MRLLVLLLLCSASAEAASAWIVRIEGDDVFVAAGRRDGLRAGSSVSAQKHVHAKNPENGRPLDEFFDIGALSVVEVGEGLSRLSGPRAVVDRLEIGDAIALPRPPVELPAPAANATASSAAASSPVACPAPTDELPSLRDAWARAQDLPPERQIEIWQRFLVAHPGSALTQVVRREITLLGELTATKQTAPTPPDPSLVTLSVPTEGEAGLPIPLAALPDARQPLQAVLVHYREPEEATFRTVHLERSGATFVGEIPARAFHPGDLQLFAEAVLPSGQVLSYADGQDPYVIDVHPPDKAAEQRQRSSIRLSYEYVDFDHFRNNDTYQVLEGDFLYRLYTGLYSVRAGFGTMQGRAAPKAFLDDPTGAYVRKVGFHYGYTEFEFRFAESLSTITRLIAGVQEDGLHLGAEGKLRIGRELGTSLVIGAAATSGIGSRVMLELDTNAVPRWPMAAEVVVTNEPIGDSAGVRLIYSVGRSLTPWLDLSLRVGYQLRDIQHSGLSGGLSTNFHW